MRAAVESYQERQPRAFAENVRVLDRGADMVLAAHRSPVRGGSDGGDPTLVYEGTLGTDLWGLGERWATSWLTSGNEQSTRRSKPSGLRPNAARQPGDRIRERKQAHGTTRQRLVPSRDVTMQATWNGAVLAESDDTVVVEGNHYFPPDSVHPEHLTKSPSHTVCFWKGLASYYTVTVDGVENRDAAWYYPHPSPLAGKIKDHVAFWHGVEVRET